MERYIYIYEYKGELNMNIDFHQLIYSLTNDYTIISNTIITNNMLLHVSTFKMSSSMSSLHLAKITYRFLVLVK